MFFKPCKTVISLCLTGVLTVFALPALSDQFQVKNGNQIKRPAADYSLPGVKPAKPIVTPPEAEPENSAPAVNSDGSFNVGNTRVKISGSITVDVGTGNKHVSNR